MLISHDGTDSRSGEHHRHRRAGGERGPTAAPEQTETPTETAKKSRVLGPNMRPQTVPDGYAHLGLYLSKDTLQSAKDAYVTDLRRLPGAPSSFAGWIARAIDNQAARTPNMRAMLAEKHREASGKKVNCAFILEDKTITALKEAVRIDHDAGRMQSASHPASEALRVAISEARGPRPEARARNDGTLIPAPARLPNHPTPKS